jgi:hypothetical protein
MHDVSDAGRPRSKIEMRVALRLDATEVDGLPSSAVREQRADSPIAGGLLAH